MSEKLSLKEIIKNLIYNFVSFALPTAILQFAIQPLLAKQLGVEMNGQYLTIMSFHYFMIGISATVLNSVRLLRQSKYEEANLCGDFNIFLLIYGAVALITVPIAWYCYTGSIHVVDILLMLVIAFLYIYHDYIFAEYRLKLQYNKILINNILMTAGYVVGWLLFTVVNKWQVVFIAAYTLPTVFDLVNTSFWKEPAKKTPLFGETARNVATLTCSSALGSVPTYCDKFILYPALGGTSVSIYHSAAIVGKLLHLVSAPINSVLLSYLVKFKEIKLRKLWKVVPIAIICLAVMYAGCVLVGYPLVSFLYPEWSDQSKILIPITVATSLLAFLNGLLNTVVLRFCKLSLQVVKQIASLAIYMVLSLIGLHFWGLMGFAIAAACSGLAQMLILIVLVFTQIKK